MPPSKLAHVVYMTRRYEQMLDWYQKVFQATVQYQNPAFAFLTYDDEHHRFAFANMSVLTPDSMDTDSIAKVGVNHVGYTYSRLPNCWKLTNVSSIWILRLTGKCITGLRCRSITEIQTAIEWSFRLIAMLMPKRHTFTCTAMSLREIRSA